jgi:hypothetical protein
MTDPRITDEMAYALDERRACKRCDGTGWLMGHDSNSANPDNPDGEYDFSCPDCHGSGLAGIDAFLDLIERAVIERPAGEAGEPPAHNPNALSQVMRAEAWKRGAAAGVAAERARWEEIDEAAFGKATCARFTTRHDVPYQSVGDHDSVRLRAFLHAYLAALDPDGGPDAE